MRLKVTMKFLRSNVRKPSKNWHYRWNLQFEAKISCYDFQKSEAQPVKIGLKNWIACHETWTPVLTGRNIDFYNWFLDLMSGSNEDIGSGVIWPPLRFNRSFFCNRTIWDKNIGVHAWNVTWISARPLVASTASCPNATPLHIDRISSVVIPVKFCLLDIVFVSVLMVVMMFSYGRKMLLT